MLSSVHMVGSEVLLNSHISSLLLVSVDGDVVALNQRRRRYIVSTMRLGVEVSKLHVLYCIYHFKCFSKMRFMERSDQKVERPDLRSDCVRQNSLSFYWLPSYILMGVLWGNQLIYRSLWSNFYITLLCKFFLSMHCNCF